MDWAVQKAGLADVVAVSVPVAPGELTDRSARSSGDEPLKRRRRVISDGWVSSTREFQVDQTPISQSPLLLAVTDGATALDVVPVWPAEVSTGATPATPL